MSIRSGRARRRRPHSQFGLAGVRTAQTLLTARPLVALVTMTQVAPAASSAAAHGAAIGETAVGGLFALTGGTVIALVTVTGSAFTVPISWKDPDHLCLTCTTLCPIPFYSKYFYVCIYVFTYPLKYVELNQIYLHQKWSFQ